MIPETSSHQRCLLGIDVGATNVRAGLVLLPSGTVYAERSELTCAELGRRNTLKRLARITAETLTHGRSLGLRPRRVGIGLPELVSDAETIDSHCSLSWRTEEPVRLLAAHGPVTVESDVRAAALAEARLGAGLGVSCFLFISVGTGISSTLMVDGRPYTGAHGHAIAFASGATCVTRTHGTRNRCDSLEARASGPAVLRRARALGAREPDTKSVCRVAGRRSGPARKAVDGAAADLALHVAVLANALDPALVLIGGGLGSAPGRYWMTFHRALRRHLWGPNAGRLPVRRAQLGPRAGLIGAAISADESARCWTRCQA